MCNWSDVAEERGIKHGMEHGMELGIAGLVEVLREMGTQRDVVIEKIMKKFSLTDEKAREFARL